MTPQNILVLTYWSYPDALIQTYTLPYLRIITQVNNNNVITLVTLEKSKDVFADANNNVKQALARDNINWKPFLYKPFGWRGLWMWLTAGLSLIRLIRRKKITVIHCFCTPPGAIGYLLSKITGCKLILDSYEPHAEAMVENGTWRKNGVAFNLLFALEKLQTRRASTVIAATTGMFQYAQQKYGITIPRYFVKPACVDLDLFQASLSRDERLLSELNLVGKVVCVYAGKLGGIYLREEVFDFFKAATEQWGDSFRVLMLTNHERSEIEWDCAKAGLNSQLVVSRFVAHADVPRYMALGHFAITPVKPVATKKYCTPIKDGEYWALGLPVVIPANIPDDSDIILQHQAGAILNEFTHTEYKRTLVVIDNILKQPEVETKNRIRNLAITYRNFNIARQIYREVYS
ncbi:MAG TPA: glycosyltransferase [Cyclobacteriaceae bacterium]|nr:glycosyltransferase [Cyclobacteriaceae bacterium]